MSDPFKLTEPACISFSGGRTSAYMLWRILQSNNGMPSDSVTCFANTGKEDEQTLIFVRECAERWDVPITWIEYRDEGYAVVDFDTAARNGEPFAALIRKRRFLPNPVTRFCTMELKIRAMARHLFALGISDTISAGESQSIIGIRADEARRAAKIADKWRIPLFLDGVTLPDVERFWRDQPFRLELPTVNGRTLSGNCDLCFLKARNQLRTFIAQKPSRATWWIAQENYAREIQNDPASKGVRFRWDMPSFTEMAKSIDAQADAFGFDDDNPAIPCFCGE